MILSWKLRSVLAVALAISPIFAADKEPKKGYTYLALGDSIPFGFDPTKIPSEQNPTLPFPQPGDFVGYPELLPPVPNQKGRVNAACPGETSGSFIDITIPDLGCNSPRPGTSIPPFKSLPLSNLLKANYTGAQLTFAVNEIQNNKDIKQITLSLGGNDLAAVQLACPFTGAEFAACVEARLLTVTLPTYAYNLGWILQTIRYGANYKKELILMTNYVPNTDPTFRAAVAALNEVMKQVGAPFGVKIADGFAAFQKASRPFGGDPCAAGLLVQIPLEGGGFVCDVHPSLAGQALLAHAVVTAH